MGRFAGLIVCMAVLTAALSGPAAAAKRVALVIGNDAYGNLPALEKAVNDARAMAATLEDIGFQVFLGENLTRRQTNRKLADFEAAVDPGDTTFFFFAGHGLALNGENYLLPADMPKPRPGEEGLVRDEAHSVNALVARVRSLGSAASFFVFDACRDNPFSAVGVRSIGGTRGLTRADAPRGVFMLFSAGIGQTALDRLSENDPDPNSVFTRKLLPLLREPGLTHVRLAKRVQEEVSELAATAPHEQQPAYYDQIIGEIVLRPGTGPAAAGPERPAPAPAATASKAAEAWATIQNANSAAVLEAFVGEFPDSVYATFAKARLDEMRSQQAAVQPAAPVQTEVPAQPPVPAAPPALAGFRIWVNTNNASPQMVAYCDRLTAAGFVVECDVTNPDLGNHISENRVYLKCRDDPDDTGTVLEAILGIEIVTVIDWRDDPDYADSCDRYDAIDLEIFNGGGSPAPVESAGSSALAGVRIWVKAKNTGAPSQVYCDRLAAAGLIVECDATNPDFGGGISENNVMLKCPNVPDGADEAIGAILGLRDLRTYDWRDDPDYADTCGDYSEITLEILDDPPMPGATANVSSALLDGMRIWVMAKNTAAASQAYCDKLAAAGLIVECDATNPQLGNAISENNVMLKCPNVPDGADGAIAAILGLPDLRTYDWRGDPDYAGTCGDYDEITLEILND